MFIVIFSIHLGWFPTSGYEEVAAFKEGWAHVVDVAHHLVLPAITLTLFYLALYTRLMRASVLDQYTMDYVVTARAKGLSERQIARRHVLRNAALPVLTTIWRASRCIAGRLSWSRRFLRGPDLDCSPTNRCSRGTSTCCSESSSFPPAWSSWSTLQSICTRCSILASSCDNDRSHARLRAASFATDLLSPVSSFFFWLPRSRCLRLCCLSDQSVCDGWQALSGAADGHCSAPINWAATSPRACCTALARR